MLTQDKTKWSYLAGFLDGEGNISIWRTEYERNNGFTRPGGYGHFGVRLSIVNTDIRVMNWLMEHFGGVFLMRDRRNINPIHKPSYVWRPKGKANLAKILLGVMPYLLLKKEQAIIALDFIRIEGQNPGERLKQMEKIQLLNKKCTSPTTNTLSDSEEESKIESDLIGDDESAPLVTADA